jgi:hypothetical protein
MTQGFVTRPSERHWWTDGDSFFVQNSSGDWIDIRKSEFESYLMKNPYHVFQGFKEEGQQMSPLEHEVLQTVLEARVSYAGPLAGWKRGVQRFEDTVALVTRSPVLITPQEGTWQILFDFLGGLVGHDKIQLQHFLYWMKHTLEALYEGRPRQGLALVLAGEAGCGKTLLKEFIRHAFGGREVYPYAYMLGRDNFNRELTEAPLWVVDDEAADTATQARIKFGAEIKKVVANSSMRCRGMHRDGLTLNPLRRLCICVNVEPDRLMVLPPIDDDIADKLLILKCNAPSPWPMPMGTHEEKGAFFQAVLKELPAFIHDMLNIEIPGEYQGRFGVRHYHHPEVVESLLQISPEMHLADQIERVLFRSQSLAGGSSWTGSVGDLKHLMLSDTSPLMAYEKNKLAQADMWIGRRLSKLSGKYPAKYTKARHNTGVEWTILKGGMSVGMSET